MSDLIQEIEAKFKAFEEAIRPMAQHAAVELADLGKLIVQQIQNIEDGVLAAHDRLNKVSAPPGEVVVHDQPQAPVEETQG